MVSVVLAMSYAVLRKVATGHLHLRRLLHGDTEFKLDI